jgi:cytochrome c553
MTIKTSVAVIGCGLLLTAGSAVLAQSPVKGNPADGAKKNSMCIGCHGIPEYKTAFPYLYRVPKIAGQSEAYLVSAMNAYRSGERNHPSMVAISKTLADQDIADLAAFYAQGGAR